MARARTTAIGAAVLMVVTACSAVAPVRSGSPGVPAGEVPSLGPDATTKPYRRTIEPPYGARPSGLATAISSATLSRDRQILTVMFLGSPSYSPTDWCSRDYTAWAATNGDVLEVAIVAIEHPDQATFPPNGACTMEGHGYLLRVVLPEPFRGTDVRDLGSGLLWVPPPERLAEPAFLPPGWGPIDLRGSQRTDPEPREIYRTYAPLDPDALRPLPTVTLGQAFNGPIGHPATGPH